MSSWGQEGLGRQASQVHQATEFGGTRCAAAALVARERRLLQAEPVSLVDVGAGLLFQPHRETGFSHIGSLFLFGMLNNVILAFIPNLYRC